MIPRFAVALVVSLSVPVWLALLVALPSPARAAVFAVDSTVDAPDAAPGDGLCASAAAACTLRAAVMEANALAGDDQIDVPAGVYALTPTVPAPTTPYANDPASGDLDFGSDSTVEIRGAGAASTIVDGAGCERVLQFLGGGLVVRDMTVQGASGEGLQATIDVLQGSQAIHDSIFRDNAGPGIAFAESGLLVEDSVVEENGGPGILIGNDGGAEIARSTVRGNEDGGIVASSSSHSIVVIDETTVHGNSSPNHAGGVTSFGDMVVTVRNSTISGNQGLRGGGLYVGDGSCCGGASLALESTTVTGNLALSGGGVLAEALDIGAAALRLRNSLIAGNYSVDGRDCHVNLAGDMVFTYASDGYNLIGNATGCPFPLAAGDLFGSDVAPIDARLTPLADHGGPTPTHGLGPRSPALDAANPSAPGASATACPAVDQRGIARPRDGNANGTPRCDIGAVEELEACSDGLDNDGDGRIDFGEDPHCSSPVDGYEQIVCGLGPEIPVALALVTATRRRRRAR